MRKITNEEFIEQFVNNETHEVECDVREVVPGLDRLLKVKAILEKKYGPIPFSKFKLILNVVLRDTTNVKRSKKKYGEGRNHCIERIRQDKGVAEAAKKVMETYSVAIENLKDR